MIPQSFYQSLVRHSICNFDYLFDNGSLCPVPVKCIHISSLQSFLKSSYFFGHHHTNFFTPPFTSIVSLLTLMSHATYIIGTLLHYITELFSLLRHPNLKARHKCHASSTGMPVVSHSCPIHASSIHFSHPLIFHPPGTPPSTHLFQSCFYQKWADIPSPSPPHIHIKQSSTHSFWYQQKITSVESINCLSLTLSATILTLAMCVCINPFS